VVQTRILLIGDDAGTQNLLEQVLSQSGFRISTTPGNQAALYQFALLQPDLVILDTQPPSQVCWELLGQLRRQSPVPIIALIAEDDQQARIDCLNQGADTFLTKPVRIKEMFARIRALLRRSRGFSYSGAAA
jgi:DNA-binding response OmpR family regulator